MVERDDGALAGCVALRPSESDGWWLENFYLAPELQGRGIGTAVLAGLLARTDTEGAPVRLQVLQGSAARALYERHGFSRGARGPGGRVHGAPAPHLALGRRLGGRGHGSASRRVRHEARPGLGGAKPSWGPGTFLESRTWTVPGVVATSTQSLLLLLL